MGPLYLLLAVAAAVALYFLFFAGKRSGAKPRTPAHRANPGEDPPDSGNEDGGKASTPGAPADVNGEPLHPRRVVKGSAGERLAEAPPRKTPRPPTVVMNADTAAFEYLDHTVIYYEPQHGNQIEYYGRDGNAYLWYPGNRGVVVSEWRIEGEEYCERSPSNAYNPVTKEWGGNWERRPVRRLLATKIDAARGDIFGLSTGRIPYPLHAHPEFDAARDAKQPPAVAQMPPPLRPGRPAPKAVDGEAPCPCGSGKSFASCHGAETE